MTFLYVEPRSEEDFTRLNEHPLITVGRGSCKELLLFRVYGVVLIQVPVRFLKICPLPFL